MTLSVNLKERRNNKKKLCRKCVFVYGWKTRFVFHTAFSLHLICNTKLKIMISEQTEMKV